MKLNVINKSNQTLVLLGLVCIFLFCVMPLVDLSFAQDPVADASAGHAEIHKKTFWTTIKEGGWIMVPLGLISMWCMGLIIEGFVRIRLPNFAPLDLVTQLRQAFAEENYQQAWRICKSRSTFLTNTLRRGLEKVGRGRSATEATISDASMKESMIYRTRISYLSTIGVCSPMVGLLGTVFGMIDAFQALGAGGISDPTKLAAAIGEVLIATATGLFVAIPAFFLYYYFRNHLQRVVILAEDVIHQLIEDVKFEDIQGLRIGEEMEAQLAAGGQPGMPIMNRAPAMQQTGAGMMGARVSQLVAAGAMACPTCGAAIASGAPRCNSCGTELQWS